MGYVGAAEGGSPAERCTGQADGRWCFLAPVQQAFPPLRLHRKVNTPLESERFCPPPRVVPVTPAFASAVFTALIYALHSAFCRNSLFFFVGTGWLRGCPAPRQQAEGPALDVFPRRTFMSRGFVVCSREGQIPSISQRISQCLGGKAASP